MSARVFIDVDETSYGVPDTQFTGYERALQHLRSAVWRQACPSLVCHLRVSKFSRIPE